MPQASPPISIRIRIIIWLTISALLITLLFVGPTGIVFFPLFPLGLMYPLATFLESYEVYFGFEIAGVVMWIGYIPYMLLIPCFFLIKPKNKFFIVLLIFITMLCLNMFGCQQMLDESPLFNERGW